MFAAAAIDRRDVDGWSDFMHLMSMGAGFNVLNDLGLTDLRPICAAAQNGDVAVSFRGPPNSPISHSAALLCLVAAGVDIPNSTK